MTEPELKDKVEELICENEVLLFMKGTPEQPRCGFSMRVVGVLDSMGVEYAALDVLPALEPLREATGEIADWRTFPQLYVKGELVGGCDIVEEMARFRRARRDARSRAARRDSRGGAPQSAKQELQQRTAAPVPADADRELLARSATPATRGAEPSGRHAGTACRYVSYSTP